MAVHLRDPLVVAFFQGAVRLAERIGADFESTLITAGTFASAPIAGA